MFKKEIRFHRAFQVASVILLGLHVIIAAWLGWLVIADFTWTGFGHLLMQLACAGLMVNLFLQARHEIDMLRDVQAEINSFRGTSEW